MPRYLPWTRAAVGDDIAAELDRDFEFHAKMDVLPEIDSCSALKNLVTQDAAENRFVYAAHGLHGGGREPDLVAHDVRISRLAEQRHQFILHVVGRCGVEYAVCWPK
jgi:hypothetical protein